MIGNNNFLKCPICFFNYGKIRGSQPPGSITVKINKNVILEGYYPNDKIVFHYKIPSCENNIYKGTRRDAYLPSNTEGREILALLKIAFERKLIFSIGTSVTTDLEWNTS